MRRIVIWLVSTVAVVVLLFTYRTSTMGPAVAETTGDAGASRGEAAGDGGSAKATAGGTRTVKGTAVQTRYGPVQVQIKVSGGKLVDVTVLQAPNSDHRDQEINGYATPILRSEALAAQSADIDTVSGATYTSRAYKQSLQAALDAAHLG